MLIAHRLINGHSTMENEINDNRREQENFNATKLITNI